MNLLKYPCQSTLKLKKLKRHPNFLFYQDLHAVDQEIKVCLLLIKKTQLLFIFMVEGLLQRALALINLIPECLFFKF